MGETTLNYVTLDETSALVTVKNTEPSPSAVEVVADHDDRYELEELEANTAYTQFEIRFEEDGVERIAAESEEVR